MNDTAVFIEVVTRGSFAAAGRALAVPNSTVSRQVAALEQRLGVQLLHRTTRKLVLTEAGRLYFDRTRHIASDLAAAERAVADLGTAISGPLRITVANALATALIVPLLPGFNLLYPDVRIEMSLHTKAIDLPDDGIDLALRLGPKPLPDSGLVARGLGHIDTGVYGHADYLGSQVSLAHPDALRVHRTLALAVHAAAGRYAWALSDGRSSVEAAITPWLVADDPLPLIAAMMRGGGLVLVGSAMLRNELASGAVRSALPGWHGPRLALHAIYQRERLRSPKIRAFVDYLVGCAMHGWLGPEAGAGPPVTGVAHADDAGLR